MLRLEFLRRKAGLTQAELGNIIHYSAAVICRLENGSIPGNLAGIRLKTALGAYFNEPFETLMQPVQDMPPEPHAGNAGLYEGTNETN